MKDQNEARLIELIGKEYDNLEEARTACAEAKALANPNSRTAKYLIVTHGGSVGMFRLVTNGDIGEKSL